jgi:hypothetical protein
MSAKGDTITKWKIFSKLWHCYNEYNPGTQIQECNLNQVFANRSNEEEIFPLTTQEIAEAQKANGKLKHCFKHDMVVDKRLEVILSDDTPTVCKDGRMIIPKPLQRRTVFWFHYYLQHPGHACLEETMNATMYWKGMRTSIRSIMKSCKSCQSNKKRRLTFGHLLPKPVVTIPWRALCVELIGPYTLKDKDGTVVDFMALTMIDLTSFWLKIVELPLVH